MTELELSAGVGFRIVALGKRQVRSPSSWSSEGFRQWLLSGTTRKEEAWHT